ncbi:MAG TPA: type II toxin-antitoxin system HicB family antitoxin [Thermoanaerobaculia bacterium]|nr:type II toxin-antitoxin system HicB family antitoxin [Thermoanaerobaculia bacterium]
MRFALALHTDDGVKYGVTVPDLPGCFSAGDSFDEAVEMAREAIDAHCELLAEKGLDIPSPQLLARHQADPDLAGAVWVVIDVNVEQYLGRAEKINITVPARLLRRIDDYAKRHGESRSGFLTRAAVQAMGSDLGESRESRSGER